jgi:hypothetical protein
VCFFSYNSIGSFGKTSGTITQAFYKITPFEKYGEIVVERQFLPSFAVAKY